MADFDSYAPVIDEEEEEKKQPYPPVTAPQPRMVPVAAPNIGEPSYSPVAPAVGAPPSEPSLAVAAANTPQPKWKDYAPPERHGWAKFGSELAALSPRVNAIVNEPRERRAEQRYEAATKEHDTQFNQGLELTKESRERGKAESEEKLRGAQADQFNKVPVVVNGQTYYIPQKDADQIIKAKQTGETQENVAGTKTQSAEKIAGEHNKTAEQIAKEKNESAERIAKGHDLAHTEAARIRAASADNPNKLTNTMKTMKQQAQATLPGIDRALDETEKVANLLGPGEGRWNDFWTGKVGSGEPVYKHYKDEIGMVQSAVTLAHARGRMSNELFEHFEKMFDAGKQNAENMIQALNVAHEWLSDYATMGDGPGGGAYPAKPKPAGGGGEKPAPPKVGDVVKGHKFKGGDPAKRENWEKVSAPNG